MLRPLLASLLLACSSNNFDIATSDSSVPAESAVDSRNEATPADGTEPETLPPAAEECGRQAVASCGRYFECAHFASQQLYRDKNECIAVHTRACEADLMLPGTGRTLELVAACAKELPSLSCTDLFALRFPMSCRYVAGKLPAGTSCRQDEQCATAFCVGGTAEQCGSCSSQAVKEGGPCPADKCPFSLACIAGVCRARRVLNESCSNTQPCGDDGYCSGAKCVARPVTPEPCATATKPCNYFTGHFCGVTSTCQAFGLEDTGKPCGEIAATAVACRAAGFCRISMLKMGTCIAPVGPEEACSNLAGPYCRAGLVCKDGTCRPPPQCGPTG